ncbi:MAG: hypothetical protein LQ340_007625, partial [Diploschistes diacapsis]
MAASQATNINWRTINVDALDPESAYNFDNSSLTPGLAPVSAAEVQNLGQQIRQLLRGGDAEGALRGALEAAPYGGDGETKELHLAAVVEILQSIKQADMSPMLNRIYGSPGGIEVLDTLMKYFNHVVALVRIKHVDLASPFRYKGMSQSAAGSSRMLSPQATGFSQIQSRGTAEGGGQAMS